MLTLIILDIYPHYYSWWMYFNYINDAFYSQIKHASFFCVTELVSTAIIYTMCSTRTAVSPRKVLAIVCISIVHLIVGGIDQFFVQLVLGHGQLYQKMRNLGFLFPDIFHVILALWSLRRENRQCYWNEIFSRRDLIMAASSICGLVVTGKLLLR